MTPESIRLIIRFLMPLAPFLEDDEVTEVIVNGDGSVWIEMDGRLKEVEGIAISEENRGAAASVIARLLGNDVDEETQPLLDARLPDGSRVSVMLAPVSVGGTVMNIRKFRSRVLVADELVRRKMLSLDALACLAEAVRSRKTILISGGPGAGKTTVLNALLAYLHPDERVLLIEDTSEIQIRQRNLVRCEARRAQPGVSEVSIRDLVKQALRHRADRLVVGEVRGPEAWDLLQAMNTGHAGTISTIHANSASRALERLRSLVAMAGVGINDGAVARMVASSIDMLVQIERSYDGFRRVTEILQVNRYVASEDAYDFTQLFRETREGETKNGELEPEGDRRLRPGTLRSGGPPVRGDDLKERSRENGIRIAEVSHG